MNTLRFFPTVILLSLLVAGNSCQKTTDLTPTATNAQTPGVSARINNQVWQTTPAATTAALTYYALPGGINPTELTLIGTGSFVGAPTTMTGRPDKITIFLANVPGTGTYPLTGGNQAIYTTVLSQPVNYVTGPGQSGTVVITRYDRTEGLLSGTFNFTALAGTTVVSITDGQFTDVPISR